jgi:hypothetical protein
VAAINNIKRTKKNLTKETVGYVGRHLQHGDALLNTTTTERNSTALASTTATTPVMFFSTNRRRVVIVAVGNGVALQMKGGALHGRKYLTFEEFRKFRRDSDGNVQLLCLARDEANAAINIARQERMSAFCEPLPASMRSSGGNAFVDEFVRQECDVERFVTRLLELAADRDQREQLGLPARCSMRWLAKQLRGVRADVWSLDDSDIIASRRSAQQQYEHARWQRGMPKLRRQTPMPVPAAAPPTDDN